ncbi:hypothetical protein BUE80_DR001382 [Diplocarpon rosae]|nr:hypothetical protein BUE80_DR001382 [Diplocarpon rosae]
MASVARYDEYPTPPPTSSPKDKHDSSQTYQGRPAKETYFQGTTGYSRAESPNHWNTQITSPYPDVQVVTGQPDYEYLPPRRAKSPRQDQHQHQAHSQQQQALEYHGSTDKNNNRPTSPLSQKTRPSSRRSFSPKGRQSPRSIYYSPQNPIPTPYNASRPAPRPGFVHRMLKKLTGWVRSWFKWCKRNPIKAGVLSCVPVIAGAGLVRTINFLGLGKRIGDLFKRMGGGQKKKGEEDREWHMGMDQFAGFGGSKGGPLEGILKILQMGINHYCRLTSSAVPRFASILLELYFLEAKK